jgi:uncharacterized protein (DUF697 family)
MSRTCKQEAELWVHRYAIGGAAFSALPLPVTSAGLATIETHMMTLIGEIYGDAPGGVFTAAAGGSFAILGQGLKWLAMQGSLFVPVAGTAVRMGIAAVTIESLGRAIIGSYERRFPGKVYTKVDAK